MQLENLNRIYFIGIGGIGMSALARYFKYQGAHICGYDKTQTELTEQLQKEGMQIHFDDDINQIDKNAELVVYTPAIPKEHAELNYYLAHNYTVQKRAEILGELTKDKFTIAVAGSHGKTTVSSMIAWILKDSGYDCTAFLGGICINFNSNFIAGKNNVFVVEADEFDRSFLQLHPHIAVITAVDADHLDIYGSQEVLEKTFAEFAMHIKEHGLLVAKANIPVLDNLKIKTWKYFLSNTPHAHLFAEKYVLSETGSETYLNNGMHFLLTYPGLHNIENAIAASSVCLHLQIEKEKIASALNQFKGIHRRFEIIYKDAHTVFIDDYAHHPEEIKMFLASVKKMYPSKKVTAVFQPHLFTRTKDFADAFAESLGIADEIILLPVYAARELPVAGVSSQIILDKIKNKKASLVSKDALLNKIKEQNFEVLCTIGAGDIDKLVKPVSEILHQKNMSL